MKGSGEGEGGHVSGLRIEDRRKKVGVLAPSGDLYSGEKAKVLECVVSESEGEGGCLIVRERGREGREQRAGAGLCGVDLTKP